MDPTLQKSFTTATKPHQVLETVREKTSTDNGRHHVKKQLHKGKIEVHNTRIFQS